MFIDKKQSGNEGEDRAAKFLKKQGYRIIARNFKTTYGEIDIVAEEKGCIVFVEVKRRDNLSFGSAELAVDRYKQKKIVKVSLQYMKMKNLENKNFRFDVVALTEDKSELIKEAFVPERGKYY